MDPNAAHTGAPLLISGGENQQLVLSAEDAAQLLAQAGIQLGDNEQVIIGDINEGAGAAAEGQEDIAAAGEAAGLVVKGEGADQQQVSVGVPPAFCFFFTCVFA